MKPRASAPRIRSTCLPLANSAKLIHGVLQRLRLLKQRHDVVKEDAFLREARDVADVALEFHDRRPWCS